MHPGQQYGITEIAGTCHTDTKNHDLKREERYKHFTIKEKPDYVTAMTMTLDSEGEKREVLYNQRKG